MYTECPKCHKNYNIIMGFKIIDNEHYLQKRKCRSCGEIFTITIPLLSNENKYVYVTYQGNLMALHRILWALKTGDYENDYLVHHLNGNKGDNRLNNLCALDIKGHNMNSHTHTKQAEIIRLRKRIKELENEICKLKSQQMF